jgi:predicted polyphosphate/ATP-dependent NAD kinase
MGNRVGFLINPIAGMGGKAGLHDTSVANLELAVLRGASPESGARAFRTLQRLRMLVPDCAIYTAGGSMGADVATSCGFTPHIVYSPRVATLTDSHDTTKTVLALQKEAIDLVLFAGGDGTARDIMISLDSQTPVLGIPAGVKMRSGVFARTPESAAQIVAAYILGQATMTEADIVDADQNEMQSANTSMHLYGSVKVPLAYGALQPMKTRSASSSKSDIHNLARQIATSLDPERLYIFGPGTTIKSILLELDLETNPLGIDITLGKDLLIADASEVQLLQHLSSDLEATLYLGVVGGQGFLLGRGNQQLTSQVIGRIGEENVVIMADREKVSGLQPPRLWVDLGDEMPVSILAGYRKVWTGPQDALLMKVVSSFDGEGIVDGNR